MLSKEARDQLLIAIFTEELRDKNTNPDYYNTPNSPVELGQTIMFHSLLMLEGAIKEEQKQEMAK